MNITLNHSKLKKALSYASKAVSTKPNIPILTNVLLRATKNGLHVAATNLEMGITLWIPGQVNAEGTTTISAKFFADFVSATFGDTVEINLSDSVLAVETQSSNAKFNTIAPEEFPVLPQSSENPIFILPALEFADNIEKVLFAASTDLTAGRIQQSGILFEPNDEGEITVVGLDGFRLSQTKIKTESISNDISKEEIIVPARYLTEVVRIIRDNPDIESVEVYLSENNSQIIFKLDDAELSIRLLEGPYPEYKRILPDDHSFTFEVAKTELEHALKVVNTFARGNLGNKVLFDFDIETGRVVLTSQVSDIGDGKAEVEVSNIDGESDLNSAYTLRYLGDFVSHCKGDTIVYETKGPLAASVLKDKDDAEFIHIIMPMRRDV